jgi:hypothetical protein
MLLLKVASQISKFSEKYLNEIEIQYQGKGFFLLCGWPALTKLQMESKWSIRKLRVEKQMRR